MTNIKDILIEYGIPYVGEEHQRGRPGWVQIDCPDCNPDSGKFYLGISLVSNASNCWKCGRKDTAKVISNITRQPLQGIRELLRSTVPIDLPERKKGRLNLPHGIQDLLPGHYNYLENRGFNADEIINLWGVQGIGQTAHLKWRLFIPIIHHGILVSWTTRSINPQEKRRYVSAPPEHEDIPHKTLLYGADYARHAIIIHEGPLDIWATGPGAVATLGTSYTPAQIKDMIHYPIRVVCFDSDREAQIRAQKLTNTLSLYPGMAYNVQLESGEDPASADQEEIQELRKRFLE